MSQQQGPKDSNVFEQAGWNPENPRFGDGSQFAYSADDGKRAEYLGQMFAGWGYQQIIPVINVVMIILGWFSVSVEALMRHRFGSRYFTFTRYLFGLFALLVVSSAATVATTLLGLYRGGTYNGRSMLAAGAFSLLFTLVYLVVGALHLIRQWVMRINGERWYTRSIGVSWLSFLIGTGVGPIEVSKELHWLLGPRLPRLTVNDWTLYRFVEPALVVVVGVFLHGALSGGVALYFYLAAITLAIKNNYLYAKANNHILDHGDAELTSYFLAAALKGEDKRNTAGFSVVRPVTPLALGAERANPTGVETLARPEDFAQTVRETLGQPQAEATPKP